MREVSGAMDLMVCPGWVARCRGPREGDWDDVVGVAVDDQYRAPHSRCKSVERSGSYPEPSQRGEFAGPPRGWVWRAFGSCEVAEVAGAVAAVVDDGGGEGAASTGGREEAGGKHNRIDPVRIPNCNCQRLDGSERVADHHRRAGSWKRSMHFASDTQCVDRAGPLRRRPANPGRTTSEPPNMRASLGGAPRGTGRRRGRRLPAGHPDGSRRRLRMAGVAAAMR